MVARALRDAGMEVIYGGLQQTPEEIVAVAIQEDVHVVGLSCLSGAHTYLFPRVMEVMRERGLENILVTCGGIIPDDDIPMLEAAGIHGVFGPGTSTLDIVDFIRKEAPERGQE